MTKININDRYPKINEIRTDTQPYFTYFKCLEDTFNLED